MKLTKENIYVNLEGKTKEELTDLWEFLTSNGEKLHRDLEWFLEYAEETCHFGYNGLVFCNIGIDFYENKTEVTIEQLKQIIKPMDLTLEQQLEKAEAEVKRLKEAIEEEDKIKVGDWVKRNYLGIEIFKANNTHDYRYINSEKSLYQKITDPILLESLNKLFKH